MVTTVEKKDEIICPVKVFLKDQDATIFHDWIAMLEHHWTRCTDVERDYTEKWWKTILFLELLLGEAYDILNNPRK